MSDVFLHLRQALGERGVLVDPHETSPFEVDWRQKFHGNAFAVVRPTTVEQVREVMTFAHKHNVTVVPQGGNTGLCGGATPDGSGGQLVLSLSRMNKIRAVDESNNTMVAEAGCILANVHTAAAQANRMFPMHLAAEGCSQIGGLVSTNAGGTAVLRYGNMRDLVLGLEVVLPNGDLLSSLSGLRKDNTGYDWKHLFIGAEGTLGIVTAATLKLYPRPHGVATVFAAVPDLHVATSLLRFVQDIWGDAVTTFEVASDACLALVQKHFADIRLPIETRAEYYVLFEVSVGSMGAPGLAQDIEISVQNAAEAGLLNDATIAQNAVQAAQLWRMREEITEAERREGRSVKHDVSLPIGSLAAFVEDTQQLIDRHADCRLQVFGHLGDGSLHVNVLQPRDGTGPTQAELFRMVHDLVDKYGGSFSAEHGVGQLKLAEMRRYKTAPELRLMSAIKGVLDPRGLLNPGKVLPHLHDASS